MQELLQLIPEVRVIKTAMNGQEAIEMVKANRAHPYDIIFLDIHMPILDGP